ncbi:GDSL-type esterase/lipase family protein [Pengzhenrongella frigida]|uniref:SGNH hydrolase-type esterase domain-containing protein n=1 Tax=Pengzhenrongella frigida TaxID=1259133 RepID=A0A4V1ZHG2_9MICO|nr:GDSL-type esterase/lipase family protein [Cellulomonas sp. HLT2-17]RYV51934.1 hypothetical protein EUA98_05930 [Cellulomonas sp. HLT2-17]
MSAPASVLFAGDSITEWGRHQDPSGWGDGYVGLLARGPLAAATVTNTGVGGDRVHDLEARWARDILPLDAEVLSLHVGVNDTWRRFDHGEVTPAAEFEAVLRRLLAPWVARGTRLVLVEPFVVPVEPSQQGWGVDLGPKQDAVRRVAVDLGAALVPLAAPMAALAARTQPRLVAADGVHPTVAGHRLIADAWWAAYTARFVATPA